MSFRFRSALLALSIVTAVLPAAPAGAQCDFPTDLTAAVFCDTNTMGMYCFANLKYNMAGMTPTLPSYRGCVPFPTPITMFMNVTACSYIMGQRRLYARRTAPVVTASCQITCDCGVLRIDETDGLPVELLDFKVSALAPARRAAAVDAFFPPSQPGPQ